MQIKHCIWLLLPLAMLSNSPAHGAGSLAEWTSAIAKNGNWQTGQLSTFTSQYTARIAANSADYEAHALRAVTQILALAENATFNRFLQDAGFKYDFSHLTYDTTAADLSKLPSMNAISEAAMAEFVPVLESALADLESIPSTWTGSVLLVPGVYPVPEKISVDLADLLLFKSTVQGVLGAIHYLRGYDNVFDWQAFEAAMAASRPAITTLPVAPPTTGESGSWLQVQKFSVKGSIADRVEYVRVAAVGEKLFLLFKKKTAISFQRDLDWFWLDLENPQMPGQSFSLNVWDDNYDDEHSRLYEDRQWTVSAGGPLVPQPQWPNETDYFYEVYDPEWCDYYLEELYEGATQDYERAEEIAFAPEKELRRQLGRGFELHDSSSAVVLVFDVSPIQGLSTLDGWSISHGGVNLRVKWNEPVYGECDSYGYCDILQGGRWESDRGSFDSEDTMLPVHHLLCEQDGLMKRVRSMRSLELARDCFKAAVTTCIAMDTAMLARKGSTLHFVEYGSGARASFYAARLRESASSALAAFDGPATFNVLGFVDKVDNRRELVKRLPGGVVTVDLSVLFSGRLSRAYLPKFELRDAWSLGLNIGTAPDPTFAGLLPGWTLSGWQTALQPSDASRSRFYVFNNGETPAPVPPAPPSFKPSNPFSPAKAMTYLGAVVDAEERVAGVLSLKVGKPNARTGLCKIGGSLMLLDGKKYPIKAGTVPKGDTPQVTSDLAVGKLGTVEVTIADNGFSALFSWGLRGCTANVTGGLSRSPAMFNLDEVPAGLAVKRVLNQCLPNDEPITTVGAKWQLGKAASVKYVKDKSSGSWMLTGLNDGKKPNVPGLKLSYKSKEGSFSGSFDIYMDTGTEDRPKLKKTKMKIVGFTVEGTGTARATANGFPTISATIQ